MLLLSVTVPETCALVVMDRLNVEVDVKVCVEDVVGTLKARDRLADKVVEPDFEG